MRIFGFSKKIFLCFAIAVMAFFVFSCTQSSDSQETLLKEANKKTKLVYSKINFAEGKLDYVDSNINLPLANKNYPNVEVNWHSSDEDIITNTGMVYLPSPKDERVYLDGEKLVAKVTLTVEVTGSYTYLEKEYKTDTLSKAYTVTVVAGEENQATGTISKVKKEAWNYIYGEHKVPKTLTNTEEIRKITYRVRVSGIVTAKVNNGTSGFFINDGTEGIYVYYKNTDISVGDAVSVVGDIYSYYGTLQIGSNVTCSLIEKANLQEQEYRVVTPDEFEKEQAPSFAGEYSDDQIGYFGGKLLKIQGYLVNEKLTGTSNIYAVKDIKTGELTWIYNKSYDTEMETSLKESLGKIVYLYAVSYDRNSKIEKNEVFYTGKIEEIAIDDLSDDLKATCIINSLELKDTYNSDFELDEAATWTVVLGDAIKIEGNKAIVTQTSVAQQVIIVAVVKVGSITLSKEFKITIPAGRMPLKTDFSVISYQDAYKLVEKSDSYTKEKYYVIGYVKEITNTTYGNMIIENADGETLTIYGSYNFDGSIRFDSMEIKPNIDDVVVFYGSLKNYNGTIEVENGAIVQINDKVQKGDASYVLSKISVPEKVSADFELSSVATWTVKAGSAITIDGNKALVKRGSVDEDVTLVATVTVDGVTLSREFKVIVLSNSVKAALAFFDFGNKKDGQKHNDGVVASSYNEKNAGYELAITNMVQGYVGAYDDLGNSCLKFGSSKKVGSFSFTVPSDVDYVIIKVACYKKNTTKIVINGGSPVTINSLSNNGEYDEIKVDTSTNKTINFTTVSKATRCMIDSIAYWKN